MAKSSPKSLQRAFPWREPLLTALRGNPKMVLACKAANISRNTVYTHLRKDAHFRRRWEHALNQGFDAVDRAYWKELGADPVIQQMIQRAREARQWAHERQEGITPER